MQKFCLTFFFVFLIFLWGKPVAEAAPGYLFGPQEFTRTNGGSDDMSEDISEDVKVSFENCERESKYQLVMENGNADGTLRVRSGKVELNGEEIIKQNEFNKKSYTVEKSLGTLPRHNTLEVKLRSKRKRFINLRIECILDCLRITFTNPAAESSTNLPLISVFGTIQSSAEQAGVVVNGYPAYVYKDRFIVNHIPLGGGANSLVAAITNSCGMRAEETLSITAGKIVDPPVQIIPFPTSGIAPFTTKLGSIVQIAAPIALYQWDFEGDGNIVEVKGDLAEVIHTYSKPGIYRPRLTVVDLEGNRYSDQIGIVVITQSEIDALLTKQWKRMKDHLSSGDIEGAMGYFAEGSSKAMFRHNFTLMKDHLSEIVSEMGEIVFERIAGNGDVAFYTMEGVQGGDSHSFQIQFQRDNDGIWRIKFF